MGMDHFIYLKLGNLSSFWTPCI